MLSQCWCANSREVSSGSPASSRPISLGTLGPNMSRSSSPTRLFFAESIIANARLAVRVLVGFVIAVFDVTERTGHCTLAYSAFPAGDDEHLLDIWDLSLLRQASLHTRNRWRGIKSRKALHVVVRSIFGPLSWSWTIMLTNGLS